MPSARQTPITSSTVATNARCSASTASRPWLRVIACREPANRDDTQPPLRPEAPKPQNSRSSTMMSDAGRLRLR